jgi:CheY-like chemotaxis protein
MIEGHGGTITVKSEPGRGARFRIELPVEAPPEAVVEAPVVEAAGPMQGKTILVVDDEPEVADVLADLLAADGHEVEAATKGTEALRRLQDHTYDLILSDMRMPELDGPSLYREIERRHPGLHRRVIFLTGDTLSPETREFLKQTGAPSLSKPFVLDEVRRVLRRVLQEV